MKYNNLTNRIVISYFIISYIILSVGLSRFLFIQNMMINED